MALDLLSKSTLASPKRVSTPASAAPSFFLLDYSVVGPSKTVLDHFSSYLDLDGGRSVSFGPSSEANTLDEKVAVYLNLTLLSSFLAEAWKVGL